MPVTKIGKCAWCERHQQTLFFTCGITDGQFYADWICGKCRDIMHCWGRKLKST